MRCLKSSLSPQFGSASDLQPPKKYLSVFACFCSEACKSLKLWCLVPPRWTNLLCLPALAVPAAELSLYRAVCQFDVWITSQFFSPLFLWAFTRKMFSCSDDFSFGFFLKRGSSAHVFKAMPRETEAGCIPQDARTNSDIVRSESGLIHMWK